MEFEVNLKQLKNQSSYLASVEKDLRRNIKGIQHVKNNLPILGSGTRQIIMNLNSRIVEIKKEADSAYKLKETLEDVIRLYESTEAVLFVMKNMSKGDWDRYSKWADDILKNLGSFIFQISDKKTRDGFSDDYRKVLQDLYDNVPVEYRDAKALYDKHLKDLKVADFNSVDKYGDPYPHNSDGKVYLNTDADLNNDRKNGTTYYHEYGHFITRKEKWVEGRNVNGPFEEFDKLLREEVSDYIKSYEDTFRQEGMDLGRSGESLKDYIKEKTKAAIELDILGEEGEFTHINNGISDIIDGVSNGTYQPYYGHPNGYWDKDPSLVPNEAFAQIFSAQMTGDEIELKKMKDIMPKTYEKYCEMIEEACKNN